MSDRFFLDTNILVYSFDKRAANKRDTARALVKTALDSQVGFISYQVIQEFLNVATRKFDAPMSTEDAKRYLQTVLVPLCGVYSSASLYAQALDISGRWQYSFYDALIVASALSINCSVLYSEDLQHGQTVYSLTIQNPFI